MIYTKYIKRYLDLFVAFASLFALSPLLVLIIILIKLDSRGPVLFKQERVGQYEKIFLIYKFRSMKDIDRGHDRQIYIGDDEITRLGVWLRRFKIDELPQLINILEGHMSIIGPRPGLKKQLLEMSQDEKRRYSVRPGLTGVAQVSGNIHNSWTQRYKYDLAYIDNMTFINDLRIILRTIQLLFIGEEKFKDKPLKLL